jgi:hypothetical protein
MAAPKELAYFDPGGALWSYASTPVSDFTNLAITK